MSALLEHRRRLRAHQSDIFQSIKEQREFLLLGGGQGALLLESGERTEPSRGALWEWI